MMMSNKMSSTTTPAVPPAAPAITTTSRVGVVVTAVGGTRYLTIGMHIGLTVASEYTI